MAAALYALGAGHEGRALAQERPRQPRDAAHRLGRHDAQHDLGVFQLGEIGGRRHRARQRQARQMAAVLAVARQRRDMLGVVSPQRDMIAFERRDIGEGDAPGAGPEHHDAGAGHLAPIR